MPFVAVADLLRADSQADMNKHAIVRGALMNALVNDQQVLTTFDMWSRHTRIGELASAAAEALDRIATAVGLEDRAQLFAEDGDVRHLSGANPEDVEHVCVNLNTIGARLTQHEGLNLLEILTGLTAVQLGLPWAFVPIELHRAYCLLVQEHVMGWTFELRPHANVLPDVDAYTEAVRSAGERLISWKDTDPRALSKSVHEELLKQLDLLDAEVPKGRAANGDGSYLEQYARWFYRHRVCGERVSLLAREYSERQRGLGPNTTVHDHPTILRGIDEAEKWLNLAEYTLRENS